MPKSFYKTIFQSGNDKRDKIIHIYLNKYFNFFLSRFKIEGMSPGFKRYFLIKLWSKGQVAIANIKSTKDATDPESKAMFVMSDFAPLTWDFANEPYTINMIPDQKTPIESWPYGALQVGSDAVVGYAQPNRKAVVDIVMFYIERIADIEMLVDSNINSQKMPFFVACSEEDKSRMEQLVSRILQGEAIAYGDFDDIDKVKAYLTGAPYLIDKLLDAKQERENELKTYLGLNNNPIEKAERLVVGEVESNNEEIDESEDVFNQSIEDFFSEANLVLGQNFTLIKEKPQEQPKSNISDEDNKGGEE
jgi:hypothetical protein